MTANNPLIFALPSKGRMQEQVTQFLHNAGIDVVQPRGQRDYKAILKGFSHVEIMLLSASDIAQALYSGEVHIGITGEDLIHETHPNAPHIISSITPLGFGKADVIVAAPKMWLDVNTMQDLDEVASQMRKRTGQRLRVATKYTHLARQFFAKHQIVDYRLVESMGATEGAPAAGRADVIVDITSTGATLAANGLKILDDGLILSSQAHIWMRKGSQLSTEARTALHALLANIRAEQMAQQQKMIIFNAKSARDCFDRAQLANAHILAIEASTGILTIPAGQADTAIQALQHNGALNITLSTVDAIHEANNPLWNTALGLMA